MSKFSLLTIVFCLLTGCTEEKSPAMLSPIMKDSKEKVYVISSPMSGTLLENGKPLANQKITRKLTWNGNSEGISEDFFTDENGKFYLPLHKEVLKLESVLEQFVANQQLEVERNNEVDEIWISGQQSGELFGETAGKEIESVICDLSNDLARVYGEDQGLLATKCRWENIDLEYKRQ